MCGLNGFLSKMVANPSESITLMNEAIHHRGPDYAGTYSDDSVTLGHTLLSIRGDPHSSRQPYTKEGSPWVLLFNGQLYNTSEIKTKYLGIQFRDVELDTELLFELINLYSWKFISKIHGMFAIVLYNRTEQKISLFRDPSGQKGIFYISLADKFAFSSDIDPLLKLVPSLTEIDEQAIEWATLLGYLPGSSTIFKSIRKVEIAEQIAFNLKTKQLVHSSSDAPAKGYYDGVPKDKIFTHLVGEHVQSRYGVALNLSGGLDSSVVLHEMKSIGCTINTYTTRFQGASESFNQDSSIAQKLSVHYGTTHHDVEVTPESYRKYFIDAYSCIGEPNYNISLPTYFQLAAEQGRFGDGLRVVLSGDGGDELFGGYGHHAANARYDRYEKLMGSFIFNRLMRWRTKQPLDFTSTTGRWLYFKYFRNPLLIKPPKLETLVARVEEISENFLNHFGERSQTANSMYRMVMMDRALWMACENFISSDKNCMTHSLEMRSPLSYHPLRVHLDEQIGGEYIGDALLPHKPWLRNYYLGKLPDYVLKATKKGWRAPIEEWYDASFKEFFLSILTDLRKTKRTVDWEAVWQRVASSDTWPGKDVFAYLSLAILSKRFKVEI